MSKDQKKTIELSVKTVDNWQKAVDYISDSIKFWFPGNTQKWPFNFIIDNLNLLSKEIYQSLENVSSSHIIDK